MRSEWDFWGSEDQSSGAVTPLSRRFFCRNKQTRQERRERRDESRMPRPRRAPLTHAAAAPVRSEWLVCPLSFRSRLLPPSLPSAAICRGASHPLSHPRSLTSSAGHVTRTRASITTTSPPPGVGVSWLSHRASPATIANSSGSEPSKSAANATKPGSVRRPYPSSHAVPTMVLSQKASKDVIADAKMA